MKIIINNKSKVVSDIKAVELVSSVIQKGRISDDGKSYCYMTTYTLSKETIAISATRNKSSDRFDVWDYPTN